MNIEYDHNKYYHIWTKICAKLKEQNLPIFDLEKMSDYQRIIIISSYEIGMEDSKPL